MKMFRLGGLLIALLALAQASYAQKEMLIGKWIFVTETYNENLVKAFGPLASLTNPDSIQSHLIKDKKLLVGSYDMQFSKNDMCESQGVKFKYAFTENHLKLNWINYVVRMLNENELLICEGEGGTCNKFYKETYFKKITSDELNKALAINHFDSLVMNCILARHQFSTRSDLFKVSALPKYTSGIGTVEDALSRNMNGHYAGLGDKEKGFDVELSFVLEPSGAASCAGLEIMETERYDSFLKSLHELGAHWVPFGKDGKPIASVVSLPIRVSQ